MLVAVSKIWVVLREAWSEKLMDSIIGYLVVSIDISCYETHGEQFCISATQHVCSTKHSTSFLFILGREQPELNFITGFREVCSSMNISCISTVLMKKSHSDSFHSGTAVTQHLVKIWNFLFLFCQVDRRCVRNLITTCLSQQHFC